MSVNETKPWWASTTIWAGLASFLLGMVSLIMGWAEPSTADAASAGVQVEQVVTGLLGLFAILGRIRANKRIG